MHELPTHNVDKKRPSSFLNCKDIRQAIIGIKMAEERNNRNTLPRIPVGHSIVTVTSGPYHIKPHQFFYTEKLNRKLTNLLSQNNPSGHINSDSKIFKIINFDFEVTNFFSNFAETKSIDFLTEESNLFEKLLQKVSATIAPLLTKK